MTTTFDRDSFADVKGSVFTLKAEDTTAVGLELSEVSELKETAAYQHFAIVFLVPPEYRVEQGLYDLSHPTLGEMQLFLVPVGVQEGRLQLEAVFNLLRQESSA